MPRATSALCAPSSRSRRVLATLRWLAAGHGYEITSADVWAAYTETMNAAEKAGRAEEARARIRTLVASETSGERFVSRTLGRALGL